jgi:hypothetical protein
VTVHCSSCFVGRVTTLGDGDRLPLLYVPIFCTQCRTDSLDNLHPCAVCNNHGGQDMIVLGGLSSFGGPESHLDHKPAAQF